MMYIIFVWLGVYHDDVYYVLFGKVCIMMYIMFCLARCVS